MAKHLLIAKNDIEGISAGILLKAFLTLRNSDLDIKLIKYNDKASIDQTYDNIFVVGVTSLENVNHSFFNSFDELEVFLKKHGNFNSTMCDFCLHVSAYLNWTWRDEDMYYAKNIDELSKYYNKMKLINTISRRLASNDGVIITELEREMIVFSKKLLTSYIEHKKYNIIQYEGKKFACVYAENNEIELANKILNNEKDLVAVILINLNNKIIRIKTAQNVSYKEQILNLNGIVNSNGGTIKLDNNYCEYLEKIMFSDIIKKLEGGNKNE